MNMFKLLLKSVKQIKRFENIETQIVVKRYLYISFKNSEFITTKSKGDEKF